LKSSLSSTFSSALSELWLECFTTSTLNPQSSTTAVKRFPKS
jgi:hypothetical protein